MLQVFTHVCDLVEETFVSLLNVNIFKWNTSFFMVVTQQKIRPPLEVRLDPPHPLPPPASQPPPSRSKSSGSNKHRWANQSRPPSHTHSKHIKESGEHAKFTCTRTRRPFLTLWARSARSPRTQPPSLPPGRASRLPALMADFVCIDTAPQTCTAERGQRCPAGGSA